MISSLLQKIPLAVIGLIFLIAILTIYIRSKNVTKSEFYKIFKGARLISVWTVFFVIAITGIFSVFNHIMTKQNVTAIIALNYSEASAAQNSNGTRFNMSEILCDEVIDRAIEKGAFEKVTAKQLKECLSVHPYVQGDASDKSKYHISTEFIIEYHASKHTDHLDAENVIAVISTAYKEYYIEKYTDNFRPANEREKPDYSTMEYMDIVAYLNKETTSVLNYLYGLEAKAPSFVSKNNTSFQAIASKVYQFKETQIEGNLKSLILQHGISRNQEDYIDRLSYQNTNTDFDKQRNSVSYNLCTQAVEMYAEEMTRIVLVPTWDNTGKYYMGRTKVGIDELSVMATTFSQNVASNEKEIMDNELIIQKMQSQLSTAEANAKADELIAVIDESIDSFTTQAIEASREYFNFRMNQCVAVNLYGNSLLDELKTIAVFAILAYISTTLFAISKKFPKA